MIQAVKEINLHQHARPERRLANAGGQLPAQPALQGTAIRQPGQGIYSRLFGKTSFQLKLPRPAAQMREEFAVDDRLGKEIVDAGFQGLIVLMDLR